MTIKCDICGSHVPQEKCLIYCADCVPFAEANAILEQGLSELIADAIRDYLKQKKENAEAELAATIMQWMEHQQAWGRPLSGVLGAQGLAAFLAQRGIV